MEMTLIAITLVALAGAAAMFVATRRVLRENERREDARVAVLAAGITRDAAPEATPVSSLFETNETPSGRERMATLAAVGGLVALVALVAALAGAGIALVGGDAATRPPAAAAAEAPLELVALTHERVGDQLVIRGRVRRLPGRPITAVVQFRDGNGTLLESAQAVAGVDGQPPGSAASFVVTLPGAGMAGRYRVSFRAGDRVLPHIDLRRATRT